MVAAEPRHSGEREQVARVGVVVAHTHWDRAWYLPFEQFRIRLVRLIDRLLDMLESDPDYSCFMLDGQMVVVEDYLQVRPEQRDRLERLIRAGRILVGPWYVLPDEFLVSAESFIRNLELGFQMSAELGGGMRVGYEPDAFGHIAQLPQIMAGFGIDNVVFWRGLGDEAHTLGTPFWWLAPDGTRALGVWLAGRGYSQFNYLGYPVRGDERNMPFSLDRAVEQIEEGIATLLPVNNTPFLLLMAGVDHEEANRHLPEIVREANRRQGDIQLHIGSLPEYVEDVLGSGREFRDYCGELRFGAVAFVLQQVYSARIHLKQRNAHCQTLLERLVEPLGAFSRVLGGESHEAFLDLCWRELLKNHPHDDICGCSVDAVHKQMEDRFDRVEQVGSVLARDSFRFLTDRIALEERDETPLFVFNPATRAYHGTMVATLAFPVWQNVEQFSIRDEKGAVVPHQEIGRRTAVDMEVNRPRPTHFVDVALDLPAIPACGYRTLRLGPAGEQPGTDLHVSGTTMENMRLAVTAQPNGTIELLDKGSGARFSGLHALEDTADAGDEYTYSPAAEGRTFTNADAQVEVELLSQGPVRAGLRICYRLALPAELAPDRRHRSAETVDYAIDTEVWLGAGENRVDFVTRVNNVARDHRLRVLFPTPMQTETVSVDGHFDVIARPVALSPGEGWLEPPSPTAHQGRFVDVSDGNLGLAVFNRGLPEYEACAGKSGTGIALTLLRCVGWLSRRDLSTRPGGAGYDLETPGAQCLGEYEFHYAVEPHKGAWEAIIHDAEAYNAPCQLMTGRTSEGLLPGDVDSSVAWEPLPRPDELNLLPERGSFVTIESEELVLSSVRCTDDGANLVVRCYNPTSRDVAGRLRLLWSIREAHLVNFLDEPLEALDVREDEVLFAARPHGIITIRCRIGEPKV